MAAIGWPARGRTELGRSAARSEVGSVGRREVGRREVGRSEGGWAGRVGRSEGGRPLDRDGDRSVGGRGGLAGGSVGRRGICQGHVGRCRVRRCRVALSLVPAGRQGRTQQSGRHGALSITAGQSRLTAAQATPTGLTAPTAPRPHPDRTPTAPRPRPDRTPTAPRPHPDRTPIALCDTGQSTHCQGPGHEPCL